MSATTNVTTIHYGTAWDDCTLLEEVKQANLEKERKDGVKRHFGYDWQEVGRYNPDYLAYVEAERERLGENHPLFLTQYCLVPVHGGGGFLDAQQKAQLKGNHSRLHQPQKDRIYIAGIDIAGESEESEGAVLRNLKPLKDSTIITIGELDFSGTGDLQKLPGIKIVEHYRWTGKKHTELYPQLADILGNVWRCRKVAIDATGIGQTVSSFLRKALGSRIKPFIFTAGSKSELGFNLLAAINSGRLKIYAGDGSDEYTGVLLSNRQGKKPLPSEQDNEFLCRTVAGTR